jgi:CBS domain-containing protein
MHLSMALSGWEKPFAGDRRVVGIHPSCRKRFYAVWFYSSGNKDLLLGHLYPLDLLINKMEQPPFMKVKDIMTQNVAFCHATNSLQVVAKMMVDCDCGCIPVVEQGARPKLLGLVTDRDIVCRALAQGKNPLLLTAREVMSRSTVTVMPETSIDDLCESMERHQVRRVPVVDAEGCVRGIVAQADVARHCSEHETAQVLKDVSVHRPEPMAAGAI